MTIVAGFKSVDGIVVCADTQETVGDISKRNVPKIRFEPGEAFTRMGKILGGGADNDLAVAFCGATNNGPYLDMLVDEAWKSARAATSLSEACDAIKQSIKDTYHEYGSIYQVGYCPTAELIYGVKMDRDSRLFYALGPAVNEKEKYASGGIGSYMADFLASRMNRYGLTVRQCVIIAAYILFQAKEHVEGCGGDSHIAVLRNDGSSGRMNWKNIETITNLVKTADLQIGEILMHYADLRLNKKEFGTKSHEVLDLLATLRESERKELKHHDDFWEAMSGGALHDDLGLPAPMPSDDETSTPTL
jgi:20S proteasome alpha/beta subunit